MQIKEMSIVTNDGKRKYSVCEKHGSSDKQNTGVCSVCGAKTTTYKEEKEVREFNIAIFSSLKTEKALKEFELFKQRKGKTWEMGIDASKTHISHFIELYFGEWDGWYYLTFDGFKGTNKNVTEKLKGLFSILQYHDRMGKCGTELKSYEDVIIIDKFDY